MNAATCGTSIATEIPNFAPLIRATCYKPSSLIYFLVDIRIFSCKLRRAHSVRQSLLVAAYGRPPGIAAWRG